MSDIDADADAEAWKCRGNDSFNGSPPHYYRAIECYTEAVNILLRAAGLPQDSDEQSSPQPLPRSRTLAICFSNRAFCHLRLEDYGLAAADGAKAIQADPEYAKGYYRRGAALVFLRKEKEALENFRTVVKLFPTNKQAKAKLQEAKKAVVEAEFFSAIATSHGNPVSETIDWKALEISQNYQGPELLDESPIDIDFVKALIAHFKSQKYLHLKHAYRIVIEMVGLLKKSSSLMRINIPPNGKFTVCGDVHGQFYDLLRIFELNGMPSPENPYLFNGDFVDRGSFSCEVIFTLFALKLAFPDGLYLTRGNHETHNMNMMYGFHGEVLFKYDKTTYDLFQEAFNQLPLAACLGGKVLVLHGGLFEKDGITLKDIESIDRNRQPPESGPMSDILWSDPHKVPGRHPSKRKFQQHAFSSAFHSLCSFCLGGVSMQFGPDITEKFLNDNNLGTLFLGFLWVRSSF